MNRWFTRIASVARFAAKWESFFFLIIFGLRGFSKFFNLTDRVPWPSLLKYLAFTISKPIFITYNTLFYNIIYIKTSIFLTLYLNILPFLFFIHFFIISHSLFVSLSHCFSIFLNLVKLLPPSDICSQNLHGLSFSSSSLINHGHGHSHSHHHQPQPQPPTPKKKKIHSTNRKASPSL